MSEPTKGSPFLGRHRAAPRSGYRPVIGAHRAQGLGGPSRGYLFTVALLAGTASMPILAAISAGSATVGNSALPDTSTPFIPTPSVGPVVIPLPQGTQSPLLPSPTPVAGAATVPPAAPVHPAAVALPDDSDLRFRHRSRPAAPAPAPGPTRTRPAGPPRPSPVPSPSPSDPATPEPSPSPTAEPTATEPTSDPSPTGDPDPTTAPPDGTPSPTTTPEESPTPTLTPSDDPDASATASATPGA
ncbi:hypothetical protein [Micromonospora sp. NPDC004551]|uniref:hypothetical protein n=1 Tax=Micromonospora sp. NPDC004551 TaxID=3154284 RepID=UPI0033A39871